MGLAIVGTQIGHMNVDGVVAGPVVFDAAQVPDQQAHLAGRFLVGYLKG